MMEEIAGNISVTEHIDVGDKMTLQVCKQNPTYLWNIHGCPVFLLYIHRYSISIELEMYVYIYMHTYHVYIYIHTYPTKQHTKQDFIKKQQTLPPYVSTASTGTVARAETDIGPSRMATLEWDEAVGG